ncbi:MAG: MBL fold metallo-hydrolase [Anaerolineales bacterium]
MTPSVEPFETNQGSRIYRIPLDTFPGFTGYAHVIVTESITAFLDVGSGFGSSNDQLADGLASIRSDFGEKVDWDSITHILISHAHIDHFGGLHFVRRYSGAPIVIHALDRKVLMQYEERLAMMENRLSTFLVRAGVPKKAREEILTLYLLNKQLFSSIEIETTYNALGMSLDGLHFTHVPGHCPGQVVAQVDDILLSADHILPEISPHQSPESLSFHTGLAHYLESLERVRPLAASSRLAMGGHGKPFENPDMRVLELVKEHRARLRKILDLLVNPMTIAEISLSLFAEPDGYHRLLAIEEAGAHVEYLHMMGFIVVDDVSSLNSSPVVPLRFRAVEDFSQKMNEVPILEKDD